MANPIQVARLLKDVRNVASPVQRMRVLARAWRTLRTLTPGERARLAAEVGIDGAEEIVERLASHLGLLKPAAVLQALEDARGADPRRLGELLRGLRDPRRRGAILKRGMREAATRLVGDSGDAPHDSPDESPPDESPATAEGGEASRPEPTSPSPRTPATTSGPAAAMAATAAATSAVPGATAVRPAPTVRSEPVAQARTPSVAATEDAPVAVSAPRSVEPPPPPAAPPRPGAGAERAEDLIGAVEGAGSVIRRLATLRSRAPAARDGDVDTLRRVLALFPNSWSRRRALAALLECGAPSGLDDALALVNELDSPGARRWCLGTILDNWDLSDEARRDLRGRRSAAGSRSVGAVDFGPG